MKICLYAADLTYIRLFSIPFPVDFISYPLLGTLSVIHWDLYKFSFQPDKDETPLQRKPVIYEYEAKEMNDLMFVCPSIFFP